jgi:cytochrome c
MTLRIAGMCGGLLLAAVSIAGFALTGRTARAQIGPNPNAGQVLAEKLCTSCHIVDGQAASASVSADVPSFVAIANKPGQTTQAIAGRIVVPHPPMPQIHLTRDEIADLAAYILSLRRP